METLPGELNLKLHSTFDFDGYVIVGLPGVPDIMLELYVPKEIPSCYKEIKQEVSEVRVGDYIQLTRVIKTPEGELRERRLVPSEAALARIRKNTRTFVRLTGCLRATLILRSISLSARTT